MKPINNFAHEEFKTHDHMCFEPIIMGEEETRIYNLAERHPHFFLKLIREYYPLSEQIIDKYAFAQTFEPQLRWGRGDATGLSDNKGLRFTLNLIEKYKNRWNWNSLSSNKSLPWSNGLIEKYKDKWNWEKLSKNESLPWSIELIEKYEQDFSGTDYISRMVRLWDIFEVNEKDGIPPQEEYDSDPYGAEAELDSWDEMYPGWQGGLLD